MKAFLIGLIPLSFVGGTVYYFTHIASEKTTEYFITAAMVLSAACMAWALGTLLLDGWENR